MTEYPLETALLFKRVVREVVSQLDKFEATADDGIGRENERLREIILSMTPAGSHRFRDVNEETGLTGMQEMQARAWREAGR